MCPVCPLLNQKMGGTCCFFFYDSCFYICSSLLSLSPPSLLLLPARPLQACCREGMRDVTEGWSGSLLVGAVKEKWGEDCEVSEPHVCFSYNSSDRRCVAVCTFTWITLWTPLPCNPFMQRRGTSPATRSQCCWWKKQEGKKKQRFMPGCHNSRSERAQLQPSAPARISLFPRVCVISVACIAVGWHGDAARPHPHDKLRAIDPCAVQIGGSVVWFCAEYAGVYCHVVERLPAVSLNLLFRPTGDSGRPVWPACVLIVVFRRPLS